MPDFATLRSRMVNNQLRTFDVTDLRIQRAFGLVPREAFVPASLRAAAYTDDMVDITDGPRPRAMMAPATLARLVQALGVSDDDVALVVGAGTGYSAAILSNLASSVIALEGEEALAERAGTILDELGITNVAAIAGPPAEGYPSDAPYDVILVDGAVETALDTLCGQLRDGGRLAVVVGRGLAGRAVLYVRSGDSVSDWPQFSAAAPILPGFERPQEFVF